MNKDLILREKLALQRTVLSNQSAFLAFIRTALYFLVAGISINNFTSLEYGYLIEMVFVAVSIILLAIGIINYRIQKIKISESEKHIGDYKDEYITTKT
jgi:putative membrane protein